MIKLKPEYKIALTVISALIVLILGINFLKGQNIFGPRIAYYGEYSDVDGLTESSPVYYNGYKIGKVSEIEFHPEREGKFTVALSLEEEIPVNENTVAQIYSLDLMGTKAVQFVDGEGNRQLEPGDTLKTAVDGGIKDQVSTQIMPIKNKMEDLIVQIDTTLSGFSGVFSDQNNQNLEEGMRSFRQMMQNLEQSTAALNASFGDDGTINNSLASIDSLAETLNKQRHAIGTSMENVAQFSEQLKDVKLDTLAGRIDSSLIAVNGLLRQTNEGEGTLGMLLSDKGLYYNLLDASANMDRLMADIRHNPKRYLSFSAIDLGRDVHIRVDDEKARREGIVYKLKLEESKDPLDIKNQLVLDKYRIFEDTNGKRYTYTIGESSSYSEIRALREEIRDQYPGATIIAFENGQPLKLKKALKKSGVKE